MEATFEKNSMLNEQRKLLLKVTMPNYVGLYFAKSQKFCQTNSQNSYKISQNFLKVW